MEVVESEKEEVERVKEIEKEVESILELSKRRSLCGYCFTEKIFPEPDPGMPTIIFPTADFQYSLKKDPLGSEKATSIDAEKDYYFCPGHCRAHALAYLRTEEQLRAHIFYKKAYQKSNAVFPEIHQKFSEQQLYCDANGRSFISETSSSGGVSRKRSHRESEQGAKSYPCFAVPLPSEQIPHSSKILAGQECIRKDLFGELSEPQQGESSSKRGKIE